MHVPKHPTRQTILIAAIVLTVGSIGHAQLTWTDIAHPDDPHSLAYDALVSIPPLLSDPNEVIELPVLVVLLEFSDVTHHNPADHTRQFFEDFTFGTGGGLWTSNEPSLRQIIEASSNGRVWIVPANETYGVYNDGIVGWVTAECQPDWYAGGYCIDGPEDDQECDLAVPGACEDGDGHCEGCDTWEYYRWKDWKKRAEAITRADPYIDFSQYDTMTVGWSAGADYQVTDNELAVMVIHAKPSCTDEHGHSDWGTGEDCNVGTVRPTDPGTIEADGIDLILHPSVIPEGGSAQVFAHEFSHQVFGLGDLYNISWAQCNPEVRSTDGTICYPCTRKADAPPTAPCNDDCADAVCLDDSGRWGGSYVARGATTNGIGSSITSCGGAGDIVDVWFTYTPDATADVTIAVDGSDFDTSLAIFDGCGGTELACNDDQPSSITMNLTQGVTYWVRVAGLVGTTGTYELNITGGGGVCFNPHDSTWFPEEPAHQSIMDNYWEPLWPPASPWANIHLGFSKPVIVADDGIYSLYRAEPIRSIAIQNIQPEVVVVNDPGDVDADKRYFILENRAPESRASPGTTLDEGLAIWRIHELTLPGDGAEPAPKRMLQLVRPKFWSDTSEVLWDGSDPNSYDLTYSSWPRNTSWSDGTESYIEFTNISAPGPVMTVDIRLPGLFADLNYPGIEYGTPAAPYNTIGEAVDDIENSGNDLTVRARAGTYPENGLIIDVPCSIKPWGPGTVYIGQ